MAKQSRCNRDRGNDGEGKGHRSKGADQASDGRAREGDNFLIVVLGASAGGLAPLKEFFDGLPPEPGMAFLVVQHRKAGAESVLAELLGRESRVAVTNAEHGQRVEPNHVYVIPAACYAELHDGAFALRESRAHQRQPIDCLLRSLAQDVGDRAAAVILSGTGTDGSLGVRAVRAEDGFVIVQNPQTTEYQGMPRSAIDSGEVDLVLAPAEMPGRLIDYARQARDVFRPADSAQRRDTPRELHQVFAMLREARGHDFSLYKTSTVLRRLQRRMAVHHLDTYRQYLGLLRHDPHEINTLYRELLIRVSGFFRDPSMFAVLERKVIPELVKRQRVDRPTRVWVPGCATGEEAYSIAILLDEEMRRRESPGGVQIFATDIDTTALALARAGRYPASISLDVSSERLARYFHGSDSHYEVDKRIRENVVFAEQSVIKDPPFSSVDLVSCRNLLIYLQAELQKRMLPLFHYALKPGGFLFLGPSESIGGSDDVFRTLDRKARIFVSRDDAPAQPHVLQPMIPQRSGGKAADRHADTPPTQSIVQIAERVLLRDHVPDCVLVDGNNQIAYFRGATGRFLEPATGAPTLDIMQMVHRDLGHDLRAVIRRARYGKGASPTAKAEVDRNDGTRVRLAVTRVSDPEAPAESLLVAFQEVPPLKDSEKGGGRPADEAQNERVVLLERELDETRQDLRATVEELETSNEELQSSNEELQSSNEELQSSNEELETSREELQSVNEELHTVNGELEAKVEELSAAQDDVNNLLASTDVGIIFLDTEQCIKRFTPAVQILLPLMESDVGRPLSHFSSELSSAAVQSDVAAVLRNGEDREQSLQAQEGGRYLLRIRPYRTARDRISGAVLAFVYLSDAAAQA